MDDTGTQPETGVQEPPKNDANQPLAPLVEEKKVDESAVEQLQKSLKQIEMERNQLRNKLQAEEDAKAKAEEKRLEEQNEFKTLYEQEKAKNEEHSRLRKEEERKKQVSEAESSVLADYSEEVKEAAKDFGFKLEDVSEDAVADFKTKLDKINARTGKSNITPNNPSVPSQKKEYSREELAVILNDPAKRDEYYRNKGGVASMMMDPAQ